MGPGLKGMWLDAPAAVPSVLSKVIRVLVLAFSLLFSIIIGGNEINITLE